MTFKDDLFNRKPLADKIVDLISISEDMREDSFVIALNASWGNGKTTFVNMLNNEIKNPTENKYEELKAIPIYYNAWEEDDYGNAFESLIYRMVEEISKHIETEPTMKNQFETIKSNLPEILLSIGKSYSKTKGIDIDALIDKINEINNSQKTLNESDYFSKYTEFKDVKKRFKDNLKKLSSEKKIIVFIDELDRCRPDFAIETLEIVKHYFNISNIVFVLSLDIEQLSHSIATCYGQNMDSAGYLRRFIDFQVNIPQGKLNSKIFEEFGENNKREVHKIFQFFNMSLRDIFKLKKDIKFFLDKFGEAEIQRKVYVNLIVIKYLYPNKFKNILYGKDRIVIEDIIVEELMPYFSQLLLAKEITIDKVEYKTELYYFKCRKINENEIISLSQHIENVIEYISISEN